MPTYNGERFDSTDYRKETVQKYLYWEEELSTREIGDVFDVAGETVRKWMEKNGVDRLSQPEGVKRALTKPYAPLEMHDHGQMRWVLCYKGDVTYQKVSRILAVSEFGFGDVCGKVVHHKNGIPWDDRPDNIQLLTPSEHAKIHHERGDL